MTNHDLLAKLKATLEASKEYNLAFHGAKDCKSCALQEEIEALIKEAQEAL